MTTSKDPKSAAAATPASQMARQTTSPQQTPSQSYFSASTSPPPSTPPPPPPIPQINDVPFVSRVAAGASRRREMVQSASRQFEQQFSAQNNGQPIPALTASVVRMDDFLQQSSSENAVERFCVWDWVDDPNVVHARTAMAEQEQEQEQEQNINTNIKS